MALQDQLSTIDCGTGNVIGSGTLGCPFNPDEIAGFYALRAGTKITDELSREVLRDLQKAGDLIPLNNAYDVTWPNEEDPVSTSPSRGLESKTRDGLYKMTATFDNGVYFQKVLKSMEGSNRWDLVLYDDSENLMLTSRDLTYAAGFKTGRFSVNPLTIGGENKGKASLTVQFSKSIEFNKFFVPVAYEELDFLPSEISGVNQVNLSITSGLADLSTSIVVKTVLGMDNNTFIGGLATNHFLLVVDGATVTPSAVAEDAVAKTYTLTVAALSAEQEVSLRLYNSADNQPVIEVGTVPDEVLYQSAVITGVTTA